MKEKNKLLIIIGLLLLIIIVIILLSNNKNNVKENNDNRNIIVTDNNKENTLNINNLEDLKVIESKMEKHNNETSIFLTVKNISNKKIEYENIEIKTLDKDNNILLMSYISGMNQMNPNDEMRHEITTDKDLSKAVKFVVKALN